MNSEALQRGIDGTHLKLALLCAFCAIFFVVATGTVAATGTFGFFLLLNIICLGGPVLFSRFVPQKIWSPLVFYPMLYSVYFGYGAIFMSEIFADLASIVQLNILVGAIGFQIGVMGALFLINPRRLVLQWDGRYVRFNSKRLFLFVFFLAVCSFSIHLYMLSSNGLIFLRNDFEEIRVTMVKFLGGYLTFLMHTSMDAVVLLLAYIIINRKSYWAMGVATLLSVLPLDIGSRTRTLIPLLISWFFYYLYFGRKIKVGKLFVYGIFFLFFLAAIGGYRLMSVESGSFGDLAGAKLASEFGLGYYTLDTLIRHVGIVPGVPYVPFEMLFSPFLTLLPGDQVVIDYYLKDSLGMEFIGGGFTPTAVGGYYIYGGMKSIFFGMAIYGVFLGGAYKFCLAAFKNREYHWPILLFYAFICAYAILGLKNGIFTSLEPLFHLVVVVVGVTFCVKRIKN